MNSLMTRLAIGLILITGITIAGITFTVNRTVDENFRRFLDDSAPINNASFITFAERYYTRVGSWDGFQNYVFNIDPQATQNSNGQNTTNNNTTANNNGNNIENRGTRPAAGPPNADLIELQRQQRAIILPAFIVTDANYEIVASNRTELIGQEINEFLRENTTALYYNDTVIGYFTRQTQDDVVLARTEQAFLDDMNSNLQLIAVGTGGTAIVLAILIAIWLSRPLRDLTIASHQVAEGKLGTRVSISGATEIREVASAFNQMSIALEESERVRRQMFSDIAHELRTPIAVMRGQLEGMLDGVFPAH